MGTGLPAMLPDWLHAIRRRSFYLPQVARRGAPVGARVGVDWRQTLKRWSRQGHLDGSPVWRRMPYGFGRLVVLWDVSGSMSAYREWFFPWLYQMVRESDGTHVFAFGTEVDNLTAHLKGTYADAVQSLYDKTFVWESGTAIGDAFKHWIDDYGNRLLGSLTTLMIISDGWDVGSPERLEAAMRMMARRSQKIIWVNPLMATAGFEPRTRALKTARNYVDSMVPGATIKDLRQLSWGFGFSV